MKLTSRGIAIFTILVLLASCSKNDDDQLGCLTIYRPLTLNINVIDSETDEDLFFSEDPKLGVGDIYFFRSFDVSRKDTIRPSIEWAGNPPFFRISPDPTRQIDTLNLKIGGFAEDKLVIMMDKTQERCPEISIDQVYLNGERLSEDKGMIRILK